MTKQLNTIIFDLDNTLTHRNQTVEKYSEYLLKSFKLEDNLENVLKIQSIIHRIDNGGYPQKERLTHSSIAASVANALIDSLDWQDTPTIEYLTDFWFDYFPKLSVEMPQARAVLESLKAKGYVLAVISNGKHLSRLKTIQSLGFEQYFDEIISSEKTGYKKPEAEIFQKTCELLNVSAQQCLFIGDHPINDYLGATNAGMSALLLKGFHDESDENIQTIENLEEILPYLGITHLETTY